MPTKRRPWRLVVRVSDETIDLDDWARRYVALVHTMAVKGEPSPGVSDVGRQPAGCGKMPEETGTKTNPARRRPQS